MSDTFALVPRRLAPLELLHRYDAHHRRTRHALKTTVAVLIITALFSWTDIQTRLMAGVAAAFLMQCVAVGSRRHQRACMTASSVIMLITSFIGSALAGFPWIKYSLLVIAAFITPQVRRRLPDHNAFPLFLFTYFLLATALPGGLGVAFLHALGVFIAAIVAHLLYFHIDYQPDIPSAAVSPSHRTALRAALAAALSIAIAMAFQLPRAYWAIMTSVLLIAETWKESTTKSAQRVGMTLAGCAAGWALHFPTAHMHHLQLVIMFICVFLAVFFRNASYPWMTFFITLYVVFLFTAIAGWTPSILLIRSYETMIGAATALLCTFLIRPEHDSPAVP